MKKKVMYILLLFFPPIGWILLLKNEDLSKMTKIALFILSSLFLCYVSIAGGIYLKKNQTSESTWKYEEYEDTEIAPEEAIQEDIQNIKHYAIIPSKKEEIKNMDAHDFVEYIRKGLKKTINNAWTVFLFEDGTGILYTDGDIKNNAFYGTITENGTMDITYGILSINGTQVTYSEEEYETYSYSLMNLVPEEYLNATTYINIEDNRITVTLTIKDDEFAAVNTMQSIIENTEEFTNIDEIIYKINKRKFIWTKKSGLQEIKLVQENMEVEKDTEEYETTQK